MDPNAPKEVTQLLIAWSNGDSNALEELTSIVYVELHRLAHHYIKDEQNPRTLQTTALVHEAFLKLVDSSKVKWESRSHFYGVCARLMRQILVDYARSRQALKRGGGVKHVSLDEAALLSREQLDSDFSALDDALQSLALHDERKSRVVELRFFGGLSVNETADVLGVSVDTVMRDWRLARPWLLREMKKQG